MTVALPALAAWLEVSLWSGVLVFFRCAAALSLLPVLGEQVVPLRVRLGLALALSVTVAPLVAGTAAWPSDVPGVLLPLAAETISGLAIGLAFRLFVFAIQIAGSIAAQSTSLSQIFATAGGDPLPAMSHLLSTAALALLVLSGFHVQITVFLAQSYALFPQGAFPTASTVSAWTLERVAAMFALGFQLSAPFVLMSILYNIMLGVINRAMPQLMVSFVGAPLITLGALTLLLLGAPLMLPVWKSALGAFLVAPAGMP